MDTQRTGRRGFLIRIAATAGGATAASLLPVSLLQAGEVCAAVATPGYADPCGDWTLDDMCSAYPPYAFDIRRGAARNAAPAAPIAPVDAMWGA